jgi:hypothetical protein
MKSSKRLNLDLPPRLLRVLRGVFGFHRYPQLPETGHDRAERGEREWYGI